MTDHLLTIENTLERLNLADDINVGAFKCLKFSQNGIIVISISLINFAYYSEAENDLKFEQFNYPLIQGIFIPDDDENSPAVTMNDLRHKKYIDIKYGPLKVRFHFFMNQNFLLAAELLRSFLPDKINNKEFTDVPVPKKKIYIGLNTSVTKSEDFEPENNSDEKINIVRDSVRVSNKFLHVVSHTVMNYQERTLKSRETVPDNETEGNNTVHLLTDDHKLTNKSAQKSPEESPVSISNHNQEEQHASPFIMKKELVDTLNSRKDINNLHQHAKVSEKFMKVASDNLISSANIKLKPGQPKPKTVNLKKVVPNLFFIFLLFLFFQTPYSRPVKSLLYNIYQQPDKISYLVNYIDIEHCELEMSSIGKIVLIYFKTNNSLPENVPLYINKSFPDGNKNDHSKDPWGKPFIFEKQANGFKVISKGPDKLKGSPDDIIKVFTNDYDPTRIN